MEKKRVLDKTSSGGAEKKAKQASVLNEYTGWIPEKSWEPSRIAAEDIDAETFFNNYVKLRKPVILTGVASTGLPTWDNQTESSEWGLRWLRELCGEKTVSVEKREDPNGKFGQGSEEEIQFSKLIDCLLQDDQRFYLSTQDLGTDEEGRPDIAAEPILTLLEKNLLPHRPLQFGNLVPQSVNMWLGCTSAGSSTGLHHDYHDNLYVLVRGSKKFRLFPPKDAPNLYMRGELTRIHPNGRVNYEGFETRADGVEPNALAAFEASMRIAQASEDELEDALDAALDAEMEGFASAEDEEVDDEEQDEDIRNTQHEPLNFSTIDFSQPDPNKSYPNYASVSPEGTCELLPSEALYLPAGWFHEVTSLGAKNNSPPHPMVHMAINFWVHPPNTGDFSKPYDTGFWPEDWRQRGLGSP